MRNFLIAAALLISANAFAQNPTVSPAPNPDPTATPVKTTEVKVAAETTKIKFDSDKHDFGKIKQGDKVKHTFTFTNVGDKDLVVSNVKPTCGCTATNWTRTAVKPGESGTIEAQFNSAGKMGKQMKFMTVIYNGEPKIERISFTGEVVPKTPVAAPVKKEAPAAPATKDPLEKE